MDKLTDGSMLRTFLPGFVSETGQELEIQLQRSPLLPPGVLGTIVVGVDWCWLVLVGVGWRWFDWLVQC